MFQITSDFTFVSTQFSNSRIYIDYHYEARTAILTWRVATIIREPYNLYITTHCTTST
jgi:hypothetical protein